MEPVVLKVVSYNIHHGEGRDGIVDLDRIAAVIRDTNADVVCLQEMDRNLPRTQHLDFPKLLSEKLGMAVVFEPNYRFDGGEYGNATFTRLDMVSHENYCLPTPLGIEPRGCLRTTVRADGVAIDILNTHLGLKPAERKEQASAILNLLRDVPTVLAGDLNETRDKPAVRTLLARLRDTAGAATPAKIDFVLVSSSIDTVSSRLVTTPITAIASDHLPFVAEISVKRPSDVAAREGIYDNDDPRVTEAVGEGK